MTRTTLTATLVALAIAVPAAGLAQESSWKLKIGDPARRDREATIVLDGITDTTAGKTLTTGELAARLDGVRVVFIGESHTDIDVPPRAARSHPRTARAARSRCIGPRDVPLHRAGVARQWNSGSAGDQTMFVSKSRWYKNWGYHWHYYRDIFLYARQNGPERMYGVNTPRDVVSAVRKKGLPNLTPEEASRIPPKIDTSNEDHKTLFRAFFAGEESMMHTMSAQMFDGMFAAQCTWDASMGYNAVQNLKKFGGPKAIMVVLIGSGHVAYNLGVQRQAALWFDGPMASIVPVPVADGKGRPQTAIQASYADFLWGLPPESNPLYPSLGLSTRDGKGEFPLEVIDVSKDTVASRAGFQVGDVLQSMDGTPLKDRETLNRLLSEKRWADDAVFIVSRGGASATVTAVFRRQTPQSR